MAAMSFLDLPAELTTRILSELDHRNLLTCMPICRRLYALIKESSHLQYHVELAAAGLKDGPTSEQSSAERLTRLQAHQQAWKDLAWTEIQDVSAESWNSRRMTIRSGVLGLFRRRTLFLTQLPSSLRGIERRDWELNFEFDIFDIAVDPSQDLLAVLETPPGGAMQDFWNIRLRSLATGEVHPRASNQPLIRNLAEFGPQMKVSMLIADDHIGVSCFDIAQKNELVVYNWRTAQPIWTLVSPHIKSFQFLAHDHILVATSQDRRETAESGGNMYPSLLLYPLHGEPRPAKHCAVFALPELRRGAVVRDMVLSSDPPPNHKQSLPPAIFASDPNDRLILLTVWISTEQPTPAAMMHFIPSATFAPFLDTPAALQAPRYLAWEEWGPAHVRSEADLAAVAESPVYGSRFVHPLPNYRDGHAYLLVWDFNTRRPAAGENVVRAESVVSLDCFENPPIATGVLPYISKEVRLPPTANMTILLVSISEDNIILHHVREKKVQLLSF